MVISTHILKALRIAMLWLGLAGAGFTGEVTVAVASNFLTAVQKIAGGFEAQSGHTVRIVNGSTGTLYAQITKGAPYDVFLSADQERVFLLAEADKLLDGAHKPYALGALVLYARGTGILDEDIKTSLTRIDIRHFAMADPALAPYGRATTEVLARLELAGVVAEKAVLGANIGQTFGFIKTGNAQIGFVALSQAMAMDGDWLDIPASYYAPILQEAGLLAHADGNAAARAFYDHLSSDAVMKILLMSGYGAPQ
jgi:molybdate transport system substrate-binding protein